MKGLKNILSKALYSGSALGGLFLVLLLAGCADLLQSPAAPDAKAGTVTLTIGGGARTVMPSESQFEKITLSFAGIGGTADLPDRDITAGSVIVELPWTGSWTVTAKAYTDEDEPPAATAANTIIWDGENEPGEIRFILIPAGDGLGTLKYSVTIPVTLDSGSRIQIEQDGAVLDTLDGDSFADGVRGISVDLDNETVTLLPGYYVVDILMVKDANTAVYRESIVILSGLVTEINFAPGVNDFLSPEERAAMASLEDLEDLVFGQTLIPDDNVDIGEPAGSGPYTLAITALAGAESVSFTVTKTEQDHVVIKEGGDSASVSAEEFVAGSSAGDELAVFTVNTSSVKDGGAKTFVLTVAMGGKEADITVTVTVEAAATVNGFGVYINSGTDEAENLTKVTNEEGVGADAIADLDDALAWLAANAANDTKYVVLVDTNYAIGSFVSKVGSTGVRITLRGLDTERAIYWDSDKPADDNGLLVINGGTALVLDNNILLHGNSGAPKNSAPTDVAMVCIRSGTLKMKNGSRIANISSSGASGVGVRVTTETGGSPGTFNMDGGKIENNTVYGRVVYIEGNCTFEMAGTATITNNTLWDDPGAVTTFFAGAIYFNSGATYNRAAVLLGTNSHFIMHGGEISHTNLRGVFTMGTFTMHGGKISHNGNAFITYLEKEYYPMGAGVMLYTSTWTMDGGEISDNGNPAFPGSGVYLNASYVTHTTGVHATPATINGPVTFTNNTVCVRAVSANAASILLGPNFHNAGNAPIDIDLLASGTEGNRSLTNFKSWWITKPTKGLLQAMPETTAEINASVVSQFRLNRVGYLLSVSPYTVTSYSGDITVKIKDNGFIEKVIEE
jgi:hypothetical protein